MTAQIKPAPVRKTVTVKVPPERAFAVFTADLGRWWPASHHIGQTPFQTVVMEPRNGGRWYEIGQDGAQCQWGHVMVWDPPRRLVLAWQISGQWAFDPDLITVVEVAFTPQADGATRVDLEHRDLERLGDAAEPMRAAFESPDGWAGVLETFRQTAEA